MNIELIILSVVSGRVWEVFLWRERENDQIVPTVL